MARRNPASKVKRARELLSRYGLKGLLSKMSQSAGSSENEQSAYADWQSRNLPSAAELEAQRTSVVEAHPLFSVVVPLFNTPEPYLRELVESVLTQTYGNFELCLADGSTDGTDRAGWLDEYGDDRIRYLKLTSNAGIAGNTNAALEMAHGDFIALADHDDLLAQHALFMYAAEIQRNPTADILYSDEDKITPVGKECFDPFFKPDYSPNLLLTSNYVCHLLVFRRELLEEAGNLRSEYDGAQDYDLVLRLSEQARSVTHIPDILYHWRSIPGSTASGGAAKTYTVAAGKKALQKALERRGISDVRVRSSELENRFELTYPLPDPPPKVSVIVSLGGMSKRAEALRSFAGSSYPDLELILVGDPNACRPSRHSALARDAVFVSGDPANPAECRNAGAAAASGEVFIFLDGNIRMERPDWAEKLTGLAVRTNAGAVGGKIYGTDFRIIEAGLTLGLRGPAGCAHEGLFADHPGSFGRLLTGMDVSALSGTCLATRRRVFEEAGGFDTSGSGLYSGIDYSIRLRQLGYEVVFIPDPAMMLAGESAADAALRILGPRRGAEALSLCNKKRGDHACPDPFYNCNLPLDAPGFAGAHYADGARAYRQEVMSQLR